MSGFNCCSLTCIQVFQDAGNVVWYSHLLENFPQFVVIHAVKDFSLTKWSRSRWFSVFPCFFYDPAGVANLFSCSSAFSKSSLDTWKISVHILLKPSLENFGHYLASVWNECGSLGVFFDSSGKPKPIFLFSVFLKANNKAPILLIKLCSQLNKTREGN